MNSSPRRAWWTRPGSWWTPRTCAPQRGRIHRPESRGPGKPGSRLHVLSDRDGLPLIVGLSAGNTHDSLGLKPLVEALLAKHDPHRGRSWKPARLHADKAYDYPVLRRWLRGRRIGVRIARRGIDTGQRLGRHRWVIERTIAWLTGYRRLTMRYERRADLYLAFLTLAAAITCHKRRRRRTT